jgi:hypothetical protein
VELQPRSPFPRAGRYEVAATGFDPLDPDRSAKLGRPVRVEPARLAPAARRDAGGKWWAWAIVGGGAFAVLLGYFAALRR